MDSLKILKSYIEINYDVIGQFCERWDLKKELFLKSLFLTVYLHDIGKLTKEFQKNIEVGKSSPKYPHALYALFIFNGLDFPNLLSVPIEKAAILGHHTQLYSQLYRSEEFERPSFLEKEIDKFVDMSTEVYKELNFDDYFPLEKLKFYALPENRKFKGIIRNELNELNTDTSSFEDKEILKSIFSFMFSILQTCDDYSSAEFSDFIARYRGSDKIFDSVMENPSQYTLRIHVADIYNKVLCGKLPYEYQKANNGNLCGDVPFHGLLLAPCGRGKTETSLIWAIKAMEKYNRNKIIFAMPTQITSNAMWERFCELFGEGETKEERIESGRKHVGLFHGKSLVKLKREKQASSPKDDLLDVDLNEIRGENFKGNVFFKPITITTIDHLIYSSIHGFSQADFAFGNLQNAVVVFDEVHYYEKQTLEHLLTFLDMLKKLKIPNLLMSGTLPAFFVEKVKEINNDYQGPFMDNEGMHFEPFRVEVLSDKNLVAKDWINEDTITEIVENYHKGLVQFVIVNTIKRSTQIYISLKESLDQSTNDPNIVLHHSQFTFKDREEKERHILRKLTKEKIRPFILVATQVIEISLDISCDIMYTEMAPGDALGQRGGRINRKGQKWISNNSEHTMKIFIPEELDADNPKKRPYDPHLLNKTKEVIENGPYSYLKLKYMCDEIYSDYTLTTPTNLKNVFKECTLFGHSPYEINFKNEDEGRLIQIRGAGVQKFDVIPWEYYAEEKRNLIVENQVKVPIWWYREDEKNNGEPICFSQETKIVGRKEIYYWVTRIPYSKEKGFDLEKLFKCPSQSNIIA